MQDNLIRLHGDTSDLKALHQQLYIYQGSRATFRVALYLKKKVIPEYFISFHTAVRPFSVKMLRVVLVEHGNDELLRNKL